MSAKRPTAIVIGMMIAIVAVVAAAAVFATKGKESAPQQVVATDQTRPTDSDSPVPTRSPSSSNSSLPSTGAITSSQSPTITPTRQMSTAISKSPAPTQPWGQLQIGVTHTQHSIDSWQPQQARNRAMAIARATSTYANQHLMGWGTLNPNPSPGVYDWKTLDERMAMISQTPSVAVITLCGAPDWMKGGQPGSTDFSKLEVAPTPEHYQDFADLAVKVAQRYPQVHYFQVWNELKGFYNNSLNRWDIEGYTTFYNVVYRALKQHNPDLKIGGPYVPMDSWAQASTMSNPSSLKGAWGVVDQRSLDAITYWLAHKEGAQFLTVDGSTSTKDKGLITSEVESNNKLAAITTWIRQRTSLPVWWSEVYPTIAGDPPSGDLHRAQVMVDLLTKLSRAGATVALIWQPEAAEDFRTAALWSSCAGSAGAAPLPLARLLGWKG